MKSFRHVTLLLTIVLQSASSIAARPTDNDPPGAKIDAFVKAEMQRQHVPGVAIAVVKDGKVLKAEGYGLANVEHEVPVTIDTIFQSGSLGKQFTAAGVMLLVEEGKLALTDPIAKFFPDAPPTWQPITIRHLLTHTSGIPDYTDDTFDYRKDYTEDQLARFAYDLKLEFPAGARWNYSNTGYVLLGIIVHKVTGRFYGDVLAERVFKPAGMKTTRVISEEDLVPHRAAGYRWVDGSLKNQEWVAPQLNTTADGSLYFSIRDLLAWDAMVRGGSVLSDKSWRQVVEPVRLNSGRTYPYGFGWAVDERAGRPLHQHGGAWQGFKTYLVRYLEDDLTIIVLANLAQADPERIAEKVATMVDPMLARPEPKPMTADPQITARLEWLLQAVKSGTLKETEAPYVRAGSLPEASVLAGVGPPTRIDLLRRETLGDDRVFTFDVAFGTKTMRVTLGLAPDDKVSVLEIVPRPE
jgi:CubicO group peptidase (beta-lactamase class C family)